MEAKEDIVGASGINTVVVHIEDDMCCQNGRTVVGSAGRKVHYVRIKNLLLRIGLVSFTNILLGLF